MSYVNLSLGTFLNQRKGQKARGFVPVYSNINELFHLPIFNAFTYFIAVKLELNNWKAGKYCKKFEAVNLMIVCQKIVKNNITMILSQC